MPISRLNRLAHGLRIDTARVGQRLRRHGLKGQTESTGLPARIAPESATDGMWR